MRNQEKEKQVIKEGFIGELKFEFSHKECASLTG
jgi:hypothetical protein